jgi:hypothetical protein
MGGYLGVDSSETFAAEFEVVTECWNLLVSMLFCTNFLQSVKIIVASIFI